MGPPAAADHGVRFEIEQNGVLGPSSCGWIFSVFHGVDYFFYGYYLQLDEDRIVGLLQISFNSL